MAPYFSRRKKLVIVSTFSAIIVGSSFLTSQITNFLSFSNRISYSSSLPSVIKSTDPNDLTFFSPVTNSKLKPLQNNQPKVDLIKPEIKKETEKPKPIEPPKPEKPKVIAVKPPLSLSLSKTTLFKNS